MSDIAALVADKEAANSLLQAGQLTAARDAYFSILIAIDSVEKNGTPDPTMVEIKIACLNNLMALFLKTKKFKEVVELSRQVLRIDPNNVKALFRQSQAFSEIEMNSDALLSLQKLLVIEPNNSQAKELKFSVMDKLNPLEDEVLEGSPSNKAGWGAVDTCTGTGTGRAGAGADSASDSSSADKQQRRREDEGKVYPTSRMPAPAPATSATAGKEASDTTAPPPIFGAGWDFMNPQWEPACGRDDDSSKSKSKSDGKDLSREASSAQQAQAGGGGPDSTAQMFLDEAERTRIKNQFFAEALQKNSAAAGSASSNSKSKSKTKPGSSRSGPREVEVNEAVSKTVEELSLEESRLVQRVEARRASASASSSSTAASKKSSSKARKGAEGASGEQVLKKKVVSVRAKS